MPLVAASSNSATTRPLRLRARADLQFDVQTFSGRTYWAVKDPVALRYFHLREEEFAVLEMLDGTASIESIRLAFDRRFAPRRVSVRDLQAFLMQLHAEGLVVGDAPGQGGELLERATKNETRRWWAAIGNPLAIRLPGFDPTGVVEELYAWCRWMFSRWFALCCTLLVVGAIALVTMNAGEVARRLPEFQQLFQLGNLPSLVIALAVAKMLHELGHAVACRHYGGRCHEMGLLLLVFTPTLYCNVSDAWMISNKWQRMAIGAAGVVVEIVLAAVCTFLWYFSVPGVFNGLCLNLMFVCSVSTLIFNANPLLRYDGYYVLFDWLEVPNARQRSAAMVGGALGRFFLEVEPPNQRWLPERQRAFLVVYAVAATLYRVVVVAGILWFASQMLKPYGLEALAHLLGVVVVAGMVAAPLFRAVTFLADPGRRSLVNWRRLLVRGGIVGGLLAVFLLVPLPARVTSAVLVQPAGAEAVYVTTAGRLVSAVGVGDRVEEHAILARLENGEIELELARLEGEVSHLREGLENLRARRNTDPEADAAIPTAVKSLADAEQRRAQRQLDRDRLELRAPVAGEVLPAPIDPDTSTERTWTGHPLEERNRGAYLETGTALCLVGDATRLEGLLVVDQSNVEFVEIGQRVYLRFDELPDAGVTGTIVDVAAIDLDVVPPQLRRHLDVPVVLEEGRPRPLSTSYLARVRFDNASPRVPIGSTGRGAITVEPRSLGQRLLRFVRRTFRFDW
jgi:putative peptide zinc metalloprotease protein